MVDKVNNQKSLFSFFKSKSTDKPASTSTTTQIKTTPENLPGFTLITNFISEAEETYIWREIYNSPWNTSCKRRIQYYGFKHEDIDRSKLICVAPLPTFSTFVVKRIMEQGLMPEEPGQLCVNEYRVGEGLTPHIDKTLDYGEEVIGISLGSDTIFEFLGPKNEKVNILLPRRSLYLMEGEVRYKWRHGIAAKKTDKLKDGRILVRSTRVSLTYRGVIFPEDQKDLQIKLNNEASENKEVESNQGSEDF